jgi:uncharacterized protein involved in exopolysaccharide biosynthesis
MQVRGKSDEADLLRSLPGAEARVAVAAARLPWWLPVLVRNWPLLVLGTLLLPLVVAALLLSAPHQYTAEALIAPTRARTEVQFEPSIRTVDDGSGQQGAGPLTPERRQALVDLVRSSAIEQQVVQQLAATLPSAQVATGELVQHISGGLRPRSEILSIQATADTPEAAVAIVNAWAHGYVEQVNNVYAAGENGTSLDAIRDQARRDLQQAQDALTASLKESRLEALDSQIEDKQHQVALLQTPYQLPGQAAANQSAVTSSQTPSPTPAPAASTVATSDSLNDYRLAERRTLDDLAQTLRRLDTTRENVRALLEQARSGASTDSTAALVLIKAQLVAISGTLPSQLQLQLPADSGPVTADQLEALVRSIEQARTEVAAEFDSRRAAYEANRTAQLAQLEDDLRQLRADRERETAIRKRLTEQRDLAQQTYTALARKAQENRVSQVAGGHEVELASEATFAAPVTRPLVPALAAAAVLGLLVAAALVLARALVAPIARHDARAARAPTLAPELAHDEAHVSGAASGR